MSWKKYGGTNKLDKINNITVNTVVADQFTLKNIYVGTWDICGGLRVRDDAIIGGYLYVIKDITTEGNLTVNGAMNVFDTNIIGNLLVQNSLLVHESIYMDPDEKTLLSGIDYKFGLNKSDPQATLDISSNMEQSLYIYSSAINNKNVIAQNSNNNAITVNVEPSRAYIDFYVDNSLNVNNQPDGRILYEQGGNMTVDVSNTMKIKPRVIFSQDLNNTLLDNERVIIYADAGTQYLPTVYNAPSFKTSMATNLVAHDNSSSTFVKLGTPQGNALIVSGGAGPSGQIMGTLALTNTSNIYPTFNIFSGILTQNLTTSVGVNKATVALNSDGGNKYVMDVNGPVHVAHQEQLLVLDASFQSYASVNVGNIVYAVGGPSSATAPYLQYYMKSLDGGYTWSTTRLLGSLGQTNPNSVENSQHIFKSIIAIDSSNIVIGGDNRYIYKTSNGGTTWTLINATGPNANDVINVGGLYVSSDQSRFIIGIASGSASSGSIINSVNGINDYTATYITTGLSAVNAVSGGASNKVVIAGSGGFRTYNFVSGIFDTSNGIGQTFYDAHTYNNSAVIVGANIIYYSSNYTNNSSWNQVAFSGTLRKVKLLDELRAIAVGDNNLIYYSTNGFSTWTTANLDTTNANWSTLTSTNANSFIISSLTKTYHLYSPYLLNRPNNNVIEASGNMVLSGDLQVNDAGQILTNNTTFNFLPTTATAINIGNATVGGNTFIKTNLDVFYNIYGYQKLLLTGDASLNSKLFVNGDVSFNSKLYLGGDASFNSSLFVNGDASFNSKVYVNGDASLNSKLFAKGDVSFNSKMYVGGDASLNSKLCVVGDASFNSKVYVDGDASLNSKLFVKGDASLNSKLFVGGDASFNSQLYVKTNAIINNNLLLTGDASLNSKLYVVGDASFNSKMYVGGDASFNSQLYVKTNAIINNNLLLTGDASLNSKLYVVGDASFNSKMYVGGDASFNSQLYVKTNAIINNNLLLTGDASLNSKLYVVGDASFNSKMYVGGDASFNSQLYVKTNAIINNNLLLTGDASLNSKLYVVGDASLNSKLRVGGDASFNSKLFVNGDASLNSRLIVGGDASMNSRLSVANDVSLNRKLYVGSSATMLDISGRNVDISNIRVNTIDAYNASAMYVGSNTATVYVQGTSDMYLGNATGNVIIQGNLFLPTSITSTNVNNLEIKNKTILLNDQASGIGVASYTGLYIRDNNIDNLGYFLQNGTMDGYIFKSTQNANRVNLDVSGLKITAGSQQFVVLRPNIISGVSADYTITTAIVTPSDISGLDASLNRRVERDIVNTTATTQVLATGLLATGLYANKTVAQIVSNTQLDINGNAIATRLGLGTNAVNTNYALDIVGNSRTTANMDISGSLTVQTNANIYGNINSYGTILQW